MSEEKDNKKVQEAVRNTPRVISVCDLIGLAEDDEDRLIYERREYESYKRML